MKLDNENNWFLNISGKKLTLKNLKSPLYLTEHIEYIKHMTKEGKYENSKGYNEFYIYQIEVDPSAHIFGLQDNSEEDDIELLEEYLSRIRQLKFQSHNGWGKSYTKQEILELLPQHKMWYITEAPFMKEFYRRNDYDGFVTEENIGFDTPFKNLCILNIDKISSIELLPIENAEEDWGLDSNFLKHYNEHIENKKLFLKEFNNMIKLNEIKDQSYARELARMAHDDMGQIRRGSGERYWTHTQTVADIVKAYGGNEAQIIAGELHDSLEDTELPLDIIEEDFSNEIRDIILELTNDEDKIKKLDKENYMNDKLVNLSSKALLVKLADILHNLSSQPKEKQRIRMINNINYLKTHRKLKGNNKELLDSILQFIKSSK
jgi:hypothetical protein